MNQHITLVLANASGSWEYDPEELCISRHGGQFSALFSADDRVPDWGMGEFTLFVNGDAIARPVMVRAYIVWETRSAGPNFGRLHVSFSYLETDTCPT